MKKITNLLLILFVSIQLSAQEYEFTTITDVESSAVKSQGVTGTCWSFSTSSFIESEILRLTGKTVDVSEMFTVRNTYNDKAWNYVMRQGKLQFSEGGLAHDVINSIEHNGIVPEAVFSGFKMDSITYNHKKIIPEIKKILDAYIKNDKDSEFPNWKRNVQLILDKEIGAVPSKFKYNGITYTPKGFAKAMKISPKNYVTLTSFKQAFFYEDFILNIPDNFSNGSMYNLPIDDLQSVVDYALNKGFTVALDVDVSERTFSAKHGIAFIPENTSDNEKGLTSIIKEKNITQEFRQVEFENYNTTDDHLMHIVGLVKDQKGNVYYKVKNSWGNNSKRIGNEGYIYMSKPYFKLKAISILLHKKGILKKIKKKLDF